ncbi:MAG: DUF1189 family protein [Anaeroplasmataceae bacterium]
MKFIDSLFRPKLIGKYINEHIIHSILYFIFFVLICSVPSVISITNTPNLTYRDQVSLFQNISNSSPSTIKVENNRLNTTDVVVFNGVNVSVSFNTDEVSNTLVYVFKESYFHVYYSGVKVSTIEYSRLSDSSFDISSIQNKDFDMIYHFLDILNYGYKDVLNMYIPILCLETIGTIIIEFAFIFIILLFTGGWFNPTIPTKFRAKMAVYALTWTFILYFIGVNVGMTWLFYIGAVISFIFNKIALSHIIRVKKE